MSTTPPDETLEGLPQFGHRPGRPDPYASLIEDDDPSPTGGPSTPTSQAPPTTSTPPPPTDPPPAPPRTERTTSSSPALSEITEGFAQLGTAVASLSGMGLNKATQRRGKPPHRRWLMTDEEAEGIGSALGRLAARRIPEEITEGDGAELLEIVSVGAAYLVRNALNVTDEDIAHAAAGDGGRTGTRGAPAHPPQAPGPTVVTAAPEGDVEAPSGHADPATMASLV